MDTVFHFTSYLVDVLHCLSAQELIYLTARLWWRSAWSPSRSGRNPAAKWVLVYFYH